MEKGEPYERKSKNPEGYVGRKNDHGYGLKPRKSFKNEGTRYPKSILNISRNFSAQQQVHPTQKPVPLMEWLIKTYSNEGETVLDNCMGSGSTGMAAVKLGRKFIGMENDKEYFKIAEERIEETVSELSSAISEKETYRISIERRNSDISSQEIISRIAKKFPNKVSLEHPDKVIQIEVLGGKTGVAIIKNSDILSVEKTKRSLSE